MKKLRGRMDLVLALLMGCLGGWFSATVGGYLTGASAASDKVLEVETLRAKNIEVLDGKGKATIELVGDMELTRTGSDAKKAIGARIIVKSGGVSYANTSIAPNRITAMGQGEDGDTRVATVDSDGVNVKSTGADMKTSGAAVGMNLFPKAAFTLSVADRSRAILGTADLANQSGDRVSMPLGSLLLLDDKGNVTARLP